MFRWTRTAALGLLAGCALSAALVAAPAPSVTEETVKDRAAYLPHRQNLPIPGKAVGVLVGDVAPFMGYDGRGGPPDAIAFSRDNGSYRWLYVHADKPTISRIEFPVGEKGDKKAPFTNLSMASATTLKPFGVEKPFALVEVEVNDGQGSPGGEHIAGTKVKVLDGSREYPLVVADAVEKCKKMYKKYVEDQKKATDAAMEESAKKALKKDEKPTGPRDTSELFYLTWLSDGERLRVAFRTTITDGAYQTMKVGRPKPGDPLPPKAGEKPNPYFLYPPPPPDTEIRWGTQFGIEFGRAYEIDKKGDLVKVQTLPSGPFSKELPPPPKRVIGRDPPPPATPPLAPKPKD